MEPQTVRFLKPSDENFMIAIPLIGIAATVGLWILGQFGISWQVTDLLVLATSLIFLDGVHIVFTYVLVAMLPELRAWSVSDATRSKSGWSKGQGFWLKSTLVAIALGTIYWVIRMSPRTSPIMGMATIWMFFEMLGPAQHGIAQMRGISLCYNGILRRKIQFTEAEKSLATQNEKLERLFFSSLLLGEILYWIPDIFGLDKIRVPGMDASRFIGGVLAIASAVAIIVNSLYFPRQSQSKKFGFVVRVAVYPLRMLSMIGTITLRAAHGTEYLVIFKRIVQGSKISESRKKRVFLVATFFSLAYAVIFAISFPVAVRQATGRYVPREWIANTLLFAFIVRYSHYYLDSVIYRMSNPATRAVIGPLLVAVPEESGNAEISTGMSTEISTAPLEKALVRQYASEKVIDSEKQTTA